MVEPLAVTGRAGFGAAFVPVVPPDLLAGLFGIEALQFFAGAKAAATPAVARVVGEQSRIEFGEAAAATGAGAADREHLLLQCHLDALCCLGCRLARLCQRLQRRQHMQHAFAQIQCQTQRLAQRRLVLRRDLDIGHRQLDAVFLEAIQTRPLRRRHEGAIDAQKVVAACFGPFRQIGVVALAPAHQRCQQSDALAAIVAQDARQNGLGALWLYWHLAIRAVLHPELDPQQAQEVIDLGQGGDRGFASAAAGALLDRDRGWNAVDGIDIRA